MERKQSKAPSREQRRGNITAYYAPCAEPRRFRRSGTTWATLFVQRTGGHACVRSPDGAVRCWGDNEHGQLGVGDTAPRLAPAPIVLP